MLGGFWHSLIVQDYMNQRIYESNTHIFQRLRNDNDNFVDKILISNVRSFAKFKISTMLHCILRLKAISEVTKLINVALLKYFFNIFEKTH